MDDTALQKHTWKTVDRLFGFDREKISQNLIAHQLESYDDFVTNKIEEIINGFNPVKIYHKYQNSTSDFKHKIELKVLNVKLSKPSISEKDGVTKVLTPLEARQRNFSYSSNLTCDIEIKYKSNADGSNSNAEGDGHVGTQTDSNAEGATETFKTLRNVSFGKIPIMVGSKCCVLKNINDPEYVSSMTSECKYDPSGYFIINGNEKVIISHDRISENKTFVFLDSKATQYSIISEIRSCPNHTFGPPKLTSIKMTAKANQFGRLFRVNIHHIRTDIPIFILFKALGIESDKMIIQSIVHNIEKKDSKILMAELAGCVHEASTVNTQSQALDFLARYLNVSGFPKEILAHKQKKIKVLLNILKNDFLPHVGENFEDKALYLGYMMKKLLLCHLGIKPFDDRDSYLNKRVDTPGVMLANLFRQYYGKLIKDCKNMIYKELNSGMWKSAQTVESLINNHNIYKIIKPTTIESGLKYGLATGNWGIKNINSKQGVAQVLNRLTFYATLSHLRRVNTPIEKSGKLIQPRKLHSTQWGVICPAETPEGGSVGLVKNLAIAAKITVSSNSEYLSEYLFSKDVIRFTYDIVEDLYDNVWVTLNGKIVGIHRSGDDLYSDLVQAKRNGVINPYTSIVWDISNNCIRLSTEGGRCVRPLYVLGANNKLLFDAEYVSRMKKENITWNDMISDISGKNMNIVEYLDVEECNSRLIATCVDDLKKDVQYTHMEIHPSLILGVLASNIPFSDHNQAPRNCYQCLWEEEPVLMADGTKKKIKEVQVGDAVLTFDPSTMKTKPTKVTNQYVRSTDKNIVEVETISGRKIITTDDHKYWTNQGWMSPREFNKDTKVGVLCRDSGSHSTNDIMKNEFSKCESNQLGISFEQLVEATHVQESTIFMPVKVTPKPNCMIADITVESETHCFFGGDSIAVHNSAMGKQAVGIYASNFRKRLDTLSHVLNYPQKPLCNTQMARKIFADEIPCGINVIVAIATWTGYNQEDSIMLNRSSVRRGLFASTYYRTIKDQCSKNLSTGEEELFVNPNNLIKNENPYKKGAYDHVQDDGTVPENTFLKPGDAILGKCMPIKTNESISYKDTSVVLKDNEYGYVDINGKNHFTNTSAEGYTFNKVRIRNYREPTIGDKLSSKHGQKGSIGMVYDEFDLPFTSEGLVPDIIINPHAIPSRMTIAQLIETIMGKACTVKGCYGNATPFTNLSIDTISRCLEEDCGLESHGNEIMYNSRSGEQIKTKIFVGPTYYQRLKHMVTDKIHSRSSAGPIVLLTRQPSEGRARAGGLRLGEMEVECSWAHGTLQFLKERIMDCSDNYRLFICRKCNNIANVNPDKSIYQCHNCDNTTNFAEVRIPYASKLMLQEIQSMGISTKMITSV